MIKVNGTPIEVQPFFDGTKKIKALQGETVEWLYESDEELNDLIMVTLHLKDHGAKPVLFMPYIPNARMDRVQSAEEVFTLKHFAAVINWLGFERVFVRDAHSFVATALLDRCVEEPAMFYIHQAISMSKADVLVYPDFGAYKRYHVYDTIGLPEIYGKKIRDWNTREILRYELQTDSNLSFIDLIKNKNVLIIDDIVSTGGTMDLAVEAMTPFANSISIYCTHLEETIFRDDKPLVNKLGDSVSCIYTTNSIQHKDTHTHIVYLNV